MLNSFEEDKRTVVWRTQDIPSRWPIWDGGCENGTYVDIRIIKSERMKMARYIVERYVLQGEYGCNHWAEWFSTGRKASGSHKDRLALATTMDKVESYIEGRIR